MKVLVTGASGFIGQHLISTLLNKGHEVVATARSNAKIKEHHWFGKVDFKPFVIGGNDRMDLFEYFNKPDHCIHLAWGGLPNYNDPLHITAHYPQHLSFLKKLIEHGLKRLLVTGTCLEYGLVEGELSENMKPNPFTPYGKGKNQLRVSIEELQKDILFDFTWARLFYMFGKGQNPKSLLAQLQNAIERGEPEFNMSGGEQQRDYLPVERIAEIIIALVEKSQGLGLVNCCHGRPVKVKKLVKDYLEKAGVNMKLNLGHYPYPEYEPFKFWGSTAKLDKILNTQE